MWSKRHVFSMGRCQHTPGAMATTSTDQMQLVNGPCPYFPPSLLPSGCVSLLSEGIMGCMTLIHLLSLSSLLPWLCLMHLPPCLRDKLPRYALQNSIFMRRTSRYKFKGHSGVPDLWLVRCRLLLSKVCPLITNIFHDAPWQINIRRGSSARVPRCQEEVWGRSRSAVTPQLTDVLSGSLLHAG